MAVINTGDRSTSSPASIRRSAITPRPRAPSSTTRSGTRCRLWIEKASAAELISAQSLFG
jgi:hypothetical protein